MKKAKETAKEIIGRHYLMQRTLTDDEEKAEIAHLVRLAKSGKLGYVMQENLYKELEDNGMIEKHHDL